MIHKYEVIHLRLAAPLPRVLYLVSACTGLDDLIKAFVKTNKERTRARRWGA